MPVNGDKTISALTFGTLLSSQESGAHRIPTFRPRIPGQPALLYRSRSTESRPDFSGPPPTWQLPARVRQRGSAQLALGGSERPAAFASRASLQQEEHYVASRWPVKSVPGGQDHTVVICSRHPLCGSAAGGAEAPPTRRQSHGTGKVSYPPTTPEPLQTNAFRVAARALHPAAGRRTLVRTRRPSPSRC